MPQDVIFHEQLSVRQAMGFAAKLRLPADTGQDEIQTNIQEVLAMLGLVERAETRIADLSGGEKKRVAVGLELLARPAVLFLDEATSGLDHATEERMMSLFRRLADDGKTVICITHFTDSLDACDLIAFFVKGRLGFYGSPAELKEYFGIRAIKDVYARSSEKTPSDWAEQYLKSRHFEKYVASRRGAWDPGLLAQPHLQGARRFDPSHPPAETDAGVRYDPGTNRHRAQRPGQIARQWTVLVRRYVQVLLGDRRNLLLMLLQPVIIGLMIALSCRDAVPIPDTETHPLAAAAASERASVLLMLVTAVLWCGGMASGREIVKERSIYLHERFVNLGPVAYIASKVPPLALVCLLQTAILCGITCTTIDLGSRTFQQFWLLCLASTTAMFLGLVVSCAVGKQDQVSSVLPVILVAQVVFSGGIIPLRHGTDLVAKGFVVAYWSYEGLKATLPDALVKTRVFQSETASGEMPGYGHSMFAIALFLIFYAGLAYFLLWRKDHRLGLVT